MLLQATEINYDYVNKRVSAVGSVQIYYSGSTLEADRVIYDETTKRMHAEGNVRLTDANGQITYGDLMNLSEDFRDGFVDSLRVETADQTRMAAARADRSSGDFTVFQSGVYTACEPCKDDPRKPPLWQIKASRIIHDTGEKMIYFENANVEFFGTPMAYFPYLSTPDPTVKRKSGFLYPVALYSSVYGAGIQVPYYWALAPDYDLTITPRLMSRQGLLMKGEWRQRLDSGYYTIALSGIYQLDKDYFLDKYHTTNYPSYRDFRGSLETRGRFAITDKWNWGWDGLVPTDSLYYSDYGLSSYQRNANFVLAGFTEGLNQVYITGRGNRSYFDARSIYYYGFSVADVQSQIPIIHPVVDYFYTFDQPVLGGELGFRTNLTSLSRNTASFDPISQFANVTGVCAPASADPMAKIPANCLLRGIPGNYSRFSAEANWKRTYTDTIGQQWTPFASLRGDVMQMSIENQIGVSNYIAPGDRGEVRAMPAAGLEYRYPFINVQSWGTQTITPVAQIIVRPNETLIGKLPNEDSQSLIFDDSNLFKINKFSGWDRIEGGGRANVGLEYTAQFNRAGFVNMMFGQSYQLFGVNSFAVGDTTNTGLELGPRHHPVRLRGAPRLPAGQDVHVHDPLPVRPGDLGLEPLRGRRPRRVRPHLGVCDVRPVRAAAGARLPDLAPRHSRHRQSQAQPELGGDHCAELRHRCAQILQHAVRSRLHRRLLYLRDELHHRLLVQHAAEHRAGARPSRHADDRAADHRRDGHVAVAG